MFRLQAFKRFISVLQLVEHAPASNHLAVTSQKAAITIHRRGLFGIGGPSEPDKEAVRNAEKMLDLMASSPKMQQLMMAAMPPAARNPETIQMLLKNPAMRQQFVQMLAKQGMKIPTDVLERMTAGHMDQTFDRATRMGLNPEDLFKKLMSHPDLLAKLQQPRIMSVFMELSTNPENAYKYQNDNETMEVIQEIRKVLGQQSASAAPSSSSVPQPQIVDTSTSDASTQAEAPTAADVQAKLLAAEVEVKAAQDIAIEAKQAVEADMSPATTSEAIAMAEAKVFAASEIRAEAEGKLRAARAEASRVAQTESAPTPPMQPPAPSPSPAPAPPPPGSPASSAFGASVEAVPNVPSGNLTAMMMADPKLAEKLQNPKVKKALEEIGKSPWKTIKYVFDKEVMEVFGALNNMMRGKDPWHDKRKKP